MIINDSKYTENKIPNWNYWRQLKSALLDDAIYLTLNINPYMMPKMLEETSYEHSIEIDERYEVVYNWANSSDWYIADIDDIQSRDKVDLHKFAKWVCFEMKWDVPRDFSLIAGVGSEQKNSDSYKSPNPKAINNDLKLIGALYEIILQKGIYKSEQAVKDYLEENYGDLKGLGGRTLDRKLAAAKRAISQK